jgi:hypothetical protein
MSMQNLHDPYYQGIKRTIALDLLNTRTCNLPYFSGVNRLDAEYISMSVSCYTTSIKSVEIAKGNFKSSQIQLWFPQTALPLAHSIRYSH